MSDYPGEAIGPDAPRTILVADSAPIDTSGIADHLAKEGFRVLAAHDSLEVLVSARRSQPDLDAHLIDGLATCRRLRRDEHTCNIPVIAMTVARNGHELAAAISAGAADYVSRPVRFGELMMRVWTHIELHLTRRQIILQQHQLVNEERRRRAVRAEHSRMHAELEQRVARSADELAYVQSELAALIEELRGSDARLQASEARFRAIVDSGPVPMCIASMPDGHLLYTNARLRELLRIDEQALRGTINMVDFYADPAQRERLVRCLAAEGSLRDAEVRMRRADGTQFWAMATACVANHDGRPAIHVGLHDISGRKRAEEDLLRSREQQRELSAYLDGVREDERKRSALEIQDDLGQLLSALKMDVSLLRMRLTDDPEATGRADDMRELVEGTIWMARNVASQLRPSALDFGLVSALEWLIARTAQHDAIQHELRIEGGEPVLSDVQVTALFRIVEAALTNVARHATAHRVDVTLVTDADGLELGVRDDGCGFDLVAAYARHAYGLLGMAERARLIGGTLGIDSEPGKGTTVTIHVPYEGN
ncbi:MAG TPA: ATP-binding protein [Paraburkholderia sp.]|uniref:ATP-binding protein n=1 Tax=Paraburkholderia sp. TaxID=1926495 RepID=UPI002B4812B6|nr:ATP-binding protein [Paraburkholderia sp.]HKR39925.1 ATP-binding protein [Paraburkholderia sp.]